MITLQPIAPHNVLIFRDVRLRALQDSPKSFGSTYAKECQLSDAGWIERTARWDGQRGIGFLAMDGSTACGIAGSFLDQDDATRALLVSMWTAPAHRQQGVGRLLVNKIAGWASSRGARTLQLMVTSTNETAISFYQRLGFTNTGRTEPYPNDPSMIEYEMSLPLS
jgi:ribosomal protein S18 acetylase RimI-like enzyme